MKNVRVLIADDSKFFQTYVKTLVESIGFEVVATVGDGQEAVDFIDKDKVDLIFLDINMPRMTGIEAVGKIIEKYKEAVIIMMTSVSDILIIQKCMELGAANYVVKNSPEASIKEIIKQTWSLYGH